jgi:NADH:ubiquinone oxidoreductase subunit 2 (subunit N)
MNTYELQLASILIFSAILLKLAAAPLHNYAIDLYSAIPLYLTMYMVTIPKMGVFLLLYIVAGLNILTFTSIILSSAIISIIIGSISLITQLKLKPFLAYSGLTNTGLLLLAIYCNDKTTFLIYLIIYIITMISIFQILLILSKFKLGAQNLIYLSQLAGLFKFNPFLSLSFTLALFSLAGCPPLLGFFAKYFLISSLLNYDMYGLVILVILTNTISCARYLSILSITQFTLTPYNLNIEISPYLSLIIATISCILF